MTQYAYPISIKIEAALRKMLKRSIPVVSTDMLVDAINIESDWVILDCRELAEFNVSHLPDAKWAGYSDFSMLRVLAIPKDAKVIVYCSIGVRSENIAEQLMASGFSNVQNLYGGIFAWANAHKTLIDQNQQCILNKNKKDKKNNK